MIQLIKASDYVRKPWKNGGGMLADIVMSPPGAGLDVFDWRISLAHVGVSGPFSVFPGIDRGMVILNGMGMKLDVEGMPSVMLSVDSTAFDFPGDAPTMATLTAGPVDDLNAMTRRDRYAQTMRRLDLNGAQLFAPSIGGTLVLYVERGHVAAGDLHADGGDTVVLDSPVALTAHAPTRLCVIDIQPRVCSAGRAET